MKARYIAAVLADVVVAVVPDAVAAVAGAFVNRTRRKDEPPDQLPAAQEEPLLPAAQEGPLPQADHRVLVPDAVAAVAGAFASRTHRKDEPPDQLPAVADHQVPVSAAVDDLEADPEVDAEATVPEVIGVTLAETTIASEP